MPFNKTDIMRRWAAFSPREQLLLMAGIASVLLATIYGFLYEPMQAENSKLQQQLQVQQQIYQHLQDVAQRVAQLRQPGNQAPVTPMEPAAAIADSSKQLDLEAYIGQQKTNAEGGVELALQHMPFDKMTYWLAVLQQQHAIVVSKLDVHRQAENHSLLDGSLILNSRRPEYPEGQK